MSPQCSTTLIALGLLAACAGSHRGPDGGIDAGVRDAGTDSGRVDAGHDAGARDAGVLRDAGFDSGHTCAPTSDHFTVGLDGYRHRDGRVTPWCEDYRECRLVPSWESAAAGGCFDGYCCNGTRFDVATCRCFCGAEPECGLEAMYCCQPSSAAEFRCTWNRAECFEFFP